MKPGTLDSLIEKSEEYEQLFNKLRERSKDDTELCDCINKLKYGLMNALITVAS